MNLSIFQRWFDGTFVTMKRSLGTRWCVVISVIGVGGSLCIRRKRGRYDGGGFSRVLMGRSGRGWRG